MNWPLKSLDELGFVGRGKSKHRPRDAPHLYNGPYPFVQTGDIKHSNLYITEYDQTYSEAGLEQSKLWKKDTLCITIAANIADTAILGFDACFPDSVIGFVPNKEKADVRYIKYLFDILQERYKKISHGAAQDNLSQEKLLSLKFPIPSLQVQTKIADILSAYDSLIENNRRRIQLLEHSARLLYREWFIYLRFPGHEHVRIIDGVPEGWEKKSLGGIIEIKKGKNITKETVINGKVPVVAGGLNPAYFHNKPNTTGPVITISASGANAGYVNIYHEDIWASDCSYISEKSTEHIYYYYSLLKSKQKEIFGLQKGTAQPHVYPKDLMRLSVVSPPDKILGYFSDTTSHAFIMIKNLITQNKSLIQARDILLPRLMNGEITV